MSGKIATAARAVEHTHTYGGQKLVHSHPGGEVEHGYYEHPEDAPKPRTEAEEARDRLLTLLSPGDTVYTVLRHVSRSGMSRHVDLYVIRDNDPVWITGHAARVIGWRQKDGALIVSGCGMDMLWHAVYTLGRCLWPEGYECPGENCPANDHVNGDRDYTPHTHRDAGYALLQRRL